MILSTVQETARCQIHGMRGVEAICRATTYLRGCGRETAELIRNRAIERTARECIFQKTGSADSICKGAMIMRYALLGSALLLVMFAAHAKNQPTVDETQFPPSYMPGQEMSSVQEESGGITPVSKLE
jgi:hypothetical protein